MIYNMVSSYGDNELISEEYVVDNRDTPPAEDGYLNDDWVTVIVETTVQHVTRYDILDYKTKSQV